MEIVDDWHDRASTVVTSQVPVEHRHEHIGNSTIADGVPERLARPYPVVAEWLAEHE